MSSSSRIFRRGLASQSLHSPFVETEKALLQRARQWDQQALAEIYDLLSPRLYRYSFRLLGTSEVAEECVAATFERFLLALRRGAGPRDYLQAYLFRIAHNWITDHYRRQPMPDLPLDPQLQTNKGTEKVALENMEIELLRKALAHLAPDQRQVLVLKYLEGWQNDQIALALSKSVGAIKALQHRGLNNLQKVFSNEMVEEQ